MLDFTTYTFAGYQVNWHHRLLCEYLDAFAEKRIKRLMVNMPPRHGKSELCSRRLPAYILGRNPDAHIMAASYSASLSNRLNRDVQRIIDSERYRDVFPDTQLYGKNIRTVAGSTYLRNSDIFEVVNHEGAYYNAGVGGSFTGMGFDYGIIDDPVKGRAEANSETISQSIADWYTGVFYTRQEKDASILVIMTRWHPRDLAGRILSEWDDEDWTVLSLPAIAEDVERLHEDDPRDLGDALWPDKYSVEFLHTLRQQNEYEFEAQYQQTPPAQIGALFDAGKIEVIDYVPECTQIVRFYDMAVTAKKSSDYTAGCKLGITANEEVIVLDMYRVQKPVPEVHDGIVQNAGIDGKEVRIRVEAEKAGIIQLDYLLRDSRMRGYTIDGKPPQGDKYTRATPVASRVNNGMVKMVRASWNRAFIDELALFPAGAHDDQVDALSGAYDMLSSKRTIEVGKAPELLQNHRG